MAHNKIGVCLQPRDSRETNHSPQIGTIRATPSSLQNRKTRLEDDFSLPLSQGKDMYLILENDMLSLVDPMDRSVLHSQPIVSIRVWGVGRDNGR